MLGKRLINTTVAGAADSCTTNTLQVLGDNSCVAYYKMSDATDESGNFDGTPTNVNFNVAGKFGNAAEFNGSSSKIATLADFDGSTSAGGTISFWFKSSDTSTQIIIGSQTGTGSAYGSTIYLGPATSSYSDESISFWNESSGASDAFMTREGHTAYTDGAWHHAVFISSNSDKQIWIDGVSKTVYYAATGSASKPAKLTDIEFGQSLGQNANITYDGLLDNVRIFNKALSSTEVTTLYNEVYCQPTIVPTDHFNPVIWNGDSATSRNITSVGFQTDFTWIKRRDNAIGATNHLLFDSVRGAGERLMSNTNTAEGTFTDELTSFITNGFTIGADASTNGSGGTFVSWNWYAPTAQSIGASGSRLASTIKKNVDAGFSIVSFTKGSGSQSIGHGLSQKPDMIILKKRNNSSSWWIWHKGLSSETQSFIQLDSSNEAGANDAAWDNQAPTASVFYQKEYILSNNDTAIAYCFHSVDGYSKIGSYVGTGASGNNIVTGFRPAFVMVKSSSLSNTNWVMLDNKRAVSSSDVDKWLKANESHIDDTGADVSFNSNGFTFNLSSNNFNGSGTYIFMAFAEEVFTPITRNATNPFGDASELALYKFESDGTDSEGNYTTTTLPNVTFASGYIGNAAVFNGSSSVITTSLDIDTLTNYTISMWVNPSSLDKFFGGTINSAAQNGIYFYLDSGGTVRFVERTTTSTTLTSTDTISINTWNHLVFVRDGSTNYIYINNGTPVSTSNSNITNSIGFTLGRGGEYIPANTAYYNGSIDQARIFNRALDSGEVTQLYNE